MRDSGRVSAFVFQGIVGVDVRLFCLVDAGSRQPGDFKGCGAILFCGVWFSAFQGFPRGGGIGAWWLRKLRKRLKTLCAPYFIWSLLGLLSTYVLTRFASTQIYSYDVTSPMWWLEVLGITTPPKFMFHLWFVKAIFLFAMFSPLIAAIVFRLPKTALMLLFLSAVFRYRELGDWPSNLMFFVIGILATRGEYLATKNTKEHKVFVDSVLFLAKNHLVVGVWFALVFLKVLMTRLGFVDLYGAVRLSDMFEISILTPINILGVAAIWTVYDKYIVSVPAMMCRYWDYIAPLAFFVYCFHWSIQHWVSAVVGRALMGRSDFLMWVLPPTITSILCLVLGTWMSIKVPSILTFLTGGRNNLRRQ